MKKNFLTLILFVAFISQAQEKKSGGKIFEKHPAIDLVDQFNAAFVAGDEAKLRSMVTDDFKFWTMNSMEPKPRTIDNMVSMSKTLSKNVLNLAIKNRGQAYSDAIEFKGANRVDVYTYKFLSGVVKNTGLILQIPRNSIFRVTKDGKKIMNVGISDSQLKWEKAMNANGTKKNGEIYIDHPHIAKARLLYAHILTGDLDAIRALYADNARISDVMNSEFDSFISPDKEIANLNEFLKEYEILNITESGYPDLLDYAGANTKTIISWWDFTVKNKKSGKIKKHSQHSQIVVNADGLIVREIYYYNAAHLPI
jgi:ketosteroid isomerase-like protein